MGWMKIKVKYTRKCWRWRIQQREQRFLCYVLFLPSSGMCVCECFSVVFFSLAKKERTNTTALMLDIRIHMIDNPYVRFASTNAINRECYLINLAHRHFVPNGSGKRTKINVADNILYVHRHLLIESKCARPSCSRKINAQKRICYILSSFLPHFDGSVWLSF